MGRRAQADDSEDSRGSVPDGSRADFIPALGFHRLTPLFDAVARVVVLDRALKARVLDRADIQAGERVLDVGAGTGTLAVAVARSAPGAAVTGLDADPKILERARRRAADERVDIRFDEGWSTDLPYPDGCFDVVLSTLVMHHLRGEDKRRSAQEIRRVLRPGGRVVIGDLGKPHDPLMRLAVLATVQLVDGFESTTPQVRNGLAGVLRAAGLSDVAVHERLRTPTGSYEVLTATAPERRTATAPATRDPLRPARTD